MNRILFPFEAISGRSRMKEALLCTLINPNIGGVLVSGVPGTAKTTTVRSFGALAAAAFSMPFVELPLGVQAEELFDSDDMISIIRHERAARNHNGCNDCSSSHASEKIDDNCGGDHHEGGNRRGGNRRKGILSRAAGGFLYVDEINLLPRHIADLLLRWGTGAECRSGHGFPYILIGTMNPNEGSLSPSLLDRFGIYVEAETEKNLRMRAEITAQVLDFEADPFLFLRRFQEQRGSLVLRIEEARRRLLRMRVRRGALILAATLSRDADAEGSRAELSMVETAMALASFDGRHHIRKDDVLKAATFALPHRMRRHLDLSVYSEPPPESHSQESHRSQSSASESEHRTSESLTESLTESSSEHGAGHSAERQSGCDSEHSFESCSEDCPDTESGSESSVLTPQEIHDGFRMKENQHENKESEANRNGEEDWDSAFERVFEPSENVIAPALISSEKERSIRYRWIEGRDSFGRTGGKTVSAHGRSVGTSPYRRGRKIAMFPTVKAALPYQSLRRSAARENAIDGAENIQILGDEACQVFSDNISVNGGVVDSSPSERNWELILSREDLRSYRRIGMRGEYILFLMDASSSMGARGRMAAVKGAVLSILNRSYQKRRRVGMIVFRGNAAELLLPFTGSIDLAAQQLKTLPVGGKTPLDLGLVKAIEAISALKRRERDADITLIVFTDGRSTSRFSEVRAYADVLAELDVKKIVVDTDDSRLRLGFCEQLSDALNGRYMKMDALFVKNSSR